VPKIVHFHYNVAGNMNIGDEAHVLAIQETLKSQIPNLEIIDLPISFLCYYQIPQTVPSARRLPLFIHNMARVLRGTSYSELLSLVNGADMVLIGGGGIYMDHLLPYNTQLLKQVKVPIVIFGAGYNSNFGSDLFDEHQTNSIIQLGHQASLQSVRDANTLLFLNKHDVKATLVGDPAVFLKKASIDPIRKSKDVLNIAINIAAHGWKQQSMYQGAIIDAYVAMMNDLRRHHKIAFHYFVHEPRELQLLDTFSQRGIEFESVINSDSRTTKAMYASMDLGILMMLHSTIFAFGEGVPIIGVGYDAKNGSFMELTAQTERFIPIQELNSQILTQKVEKLLSERTAAKTLLQKQLALHKTKYDAFTKEVIALLD
jgi:polysaccharide pyruvyl transferase WcaK-like protein